MPLEKLKIENFTAFGKLDMEFSSGINVFVGANSTGKTHIMKVLYAACAITSKLKKKDVRFLDKLNRVFLPSELKISHLIRRPVGRNRAIRRNCHIEILRDGLKLWTSFSNVQTTVEKIVVHGHDKWCDNYVSSVYIPVKEMLANAPGFVSHYARREIHFEEIYFDIINAASSDPLRGPAGNARKKLERILEDAIEGRVIRENSGEFFLKNSQGNLEFTLLAEGMRKLGLLLLLIKNGTLLEEPNSILFWDEPEANLNPSMMPIVAKILNELQRMGVQVFIATHDMVLASSLDFERTDKDRHLFHSLWREPEIDGIAYAPSPSFAEIDRNLINDTFVSLADQDIARALKRVK